jgi:O-antigen ligase
VGLAQRPFAVTTALAALTCALAPTYVIRWHLGPLPSTVLEVAILVTVLAFTVESVRTRTAVRWNSPFAIPAALFLVAGAVAVVVSPEQVKGLGLYRAYLIEPIAFFFVLGNVLDNAQRARLVLLGLAVGGAVAGVANSLVVADAFRHHTLNLALPPPVVIYNTSNATALYLVPLIGIAASLALYERDRIVRLVSAAFLAMFVASTVLSLSRAGVVALGVLAIVLAAMHRRRLILLPAIAALGIASTFIPAVASRLAPEFDPAHPNNTLLSRAHLWQVTLEMLRDHPIFGTGLYGFAKSIQPYRGGVYEEKLIYPHNLVLNFWTELGILGVASFIWLLVQAFRVGFQGWVRGALSWRPLQLGIVLAMVAVVVHGMVDVPYFKNDLALEFWVFLGVAWAGAQQSLGADV